MIFKSNDKFFPVSTQFIYIDIHIKHIFDQLLCYLSSTHLNKNYTCEVLKILDHEKSCRQVRQFNSREREETKSKISSLITLVSVENGLESIRSRLTAAKKSHHLKRRKGSKNIVQDWTAGEKLLGVNYCVCGKLIFHLKHERNSIISWLFKRKIDWKWTGA